MKAIPRWALLAALCLAAGAQAQSVTEAVTFPGQQPKSSPDWSPPATLRMTVEPAAVAPAAPVAVHDSAQSIAEYQRCRLVSDRAAVSNTERTAGLQACLRDLQARREAQP